MIIHTANFVTSNTHVEKCPAPNLPEFAFIGRSNVGKSSLINALTNRSTLAKTSGRPGKTQLINHFKINNNWYLVDLPGYGWAQVSKVKKAEFSKMNERYLLERKNLVCTFVLIDIRLEPQAIDLGFLQWMGEKGLPFCMVYTKADKLSTTGIESNIRAYQEKLLETWEETPMYFITSAEKRTGIEEMLGYIGDLCQSFVK